MNRPRTPFTETQATYNRTQLRRQAEAHGRMLGRLVTLNIILAVIVLVELIVK
jgi:hypothetical protein